MREGQVLYKTKMKTKNPAAVALGALGGKVKSKKKAKSSAENGKKGGRPKKFLPKGTAFSGFGTPDDGQNYSV